MMGRLDLVQAILADDPQSATRIDPDDWPPLVQAAGWGRLEVMRVLLAAGADPNGAGSGGTTPLHAAVEWAGHLDAARLLLAAGADADVPDARGRSGRESAARREEPTWRDLFSPA